MIKHKKYQLVMFMLCISVMLTSGCVEQVSNSGQQLLDEGKELFYNGVDYCQETIPESIKSLDQYIKNIPIESLFVIPEEPRIIEAISNLEPIDSNIIDYFKGYHATADGANAIINILDNEGNIEIGFDGTRDEYEKVSKIVTKWTPIIGNYNDLVYSARAYDKNNPDTIKEYYKSLGLFCFEISIIYTHIWWKPSYAIIGKLYRCSGLNSLAFKCPSVISYILSTAHWGLRNYLTDKTTDSATLLIDELTANQISFDIKGIFNSD
jgi:hypothetical protein